MLKQLIGNKTQIESLMNTVFNTICAFQNEEEEIFVQYEAEEIDNETMIIKWDTEELTDVQNLMLDTVLYYRSQDKLLWQGVTSEYKLEVPAENHFRIITTLDKYEKLAEDYFVYNNVSDQQYRCLVYPLSLTANLNKVELIAVGLTEEQMEILPSQAKTQQKAQVINKKITKIGNKMASSTKVVMNDVVNPLGKATAKTGAIVAGGLAKTGVDMALTAANEVMREAAGLSLSELRKRDEIQTMKYSFNKLLGKTSQPKAKQSANSFSL